MPEQVIEVANNIEPVADVASETASNVAQTGSSWGMILYCLVVFGIIYLFIVLPNKRRMAEYQKMLDSITVGNRVLAAGIYGTVKSVSEKSVEVEIAKGVVVEFSKNAIARVEK